MIVNSSAMRYGTVKRVVDRACGYLASFRIVPVSAEAATDFRTVDHRAKTNEAAGITITEYKSFSSEQAASLRSVPNPCMTVIPTRMDVAGMSVQKLFSMPGSESGQDCHRNAKAIQARAETYRGRVRGDHGSPDLISDVTRVPR